jgi:hypothetical protein
MWRIAAVTILGIDALLGIWLMATGSTERGSIMLFLAGVFIGAVIFVMSKPPVIQVVKDMSAHERRTALLQQNGGHYTDQEWQALCQRYNYCCAACGRRRPLTADHVVPVTSGGSSNISNIQPLCRPCNSAKGTRTVDYRGTQ